jgi:hypothetical protein
MRRAVTYLAVAAILGIGIAAAVDGVRGGSVGDAEPDQTLGDGPLVVVAEEGDDHARLAVGASISVERPAGVAVADGSVWVASRGALVQIDPARDARQGAILLGGRPGAVVADGEAVYVLDELTGDAVRIELASASISGRLSTGGVVLDIAFADGDAWIPDPAGSAVLRVDPVDGSLVARIGVPAPTAVVAGAGAVWALSPGAKVVSHIDPASNLVSAIALEDVPGEVAVVGDTVWVSHPSASALSRIDPVRDAVAARVELGSNPLLIAPGGAGLWVLGLDRLTLLDTRTERIAGTAELELSRPPGPAPAILGGLAADGGNAWVADTYGDVVLRVPAPG